MTTLVDSNVLFDVLQEDEEWLDWSASMLAQAAERGALAINPIIYAEVCAGYDTIEELDRVMPLEFYRREPLPWAAGFLASRAFLSYRRRGGARRSPLPDFYIGAHAAVAGHTLLTRDPTRYRRYFPKLRIIAP
ncbi:MAG TPA: type II toxin-antitoxin system VapC family toxin [Vicinamibacterales bacterium]|nr:type II toxin-antitoxin system VapC family toxin [Vicinamibacterales bacterium]